MLDTKMLSTHSDMEMGRHLHIPARSVRVRVLDTLYNKRCMVRHRPSLLIGTSSNLFRMKRLACQHLKHSV